MTAEENIESINFVNEQNEQKTLLSDEERQVEKGEENKISSKIKESQNKLFETKLPSIKKEKTKTTLQKITPTFNQFSI